MRQASKSKRYTEQRCPVNCSVDCLGWTKHSEQRTEKFSKIDEQHRQSEHLTVRTPKILKHSERGNQSEHLLFEYLGTLVTNIQMSPTDQCHQQHCYTLDVPLWSFFQNKWFDTSILRHLHSITSVWLILYESYRNCMRWKNESFMKVDVSQGLLLNERHHVIYWNN